MPLCTAFSLPHANSAKTMIVFSIKTVVQAVQGVRPAWL